MNVNVNRFVESLAPETEGYFSYGEKKTITPLGIPARKDGALRAPQPKRRYVRKKGDRNKKFHLEKQDETPTIELSYLDRLDLELMQLDNDIARSVRKVKKAQKKQKGRTSRTGWTGRTGEKIYETHS